MKQKHLPLKVSKTNIKLNNVNNSNIKPLLINPTKYKNIEIKKSKTPKYNKEKKFRNTPDNTSEYQAKIQRIKNKFPSLGGLMNNALKANDTHDFFFYIQNNPLNNYIKNVNNTEASLEKKNYQLEEKEEPLNLGLKTESNVIDNNEDKLFRSDMWNANSEGMNIINSYKNKENIGNINNIINNEKINYRLNNSDLKYTNTEIYNTKNDNINSEITKNNINEKKKNSKNSLNIQIKNKNNGNKLKNKFSINHLYSNSNKLYNNINTSSNSINNYFKIKNMNLHFLSETHSYSTEKNILKNKNDKDKESLKYLNYSINDINNNTCKSGDFVLRKKIKSDLDSIKKNKELSLKLENASKELDKMQNIRDKYITCINKNINMKKEYKDAKRKYEYYSKEIENKTNEINEQKVLISKLYDEINIKNDYIKEVKEMLIKKDEIINILNNKIKTLKGKSEQLSNENNILYKFKELYNENASKNIKLESNMNQYLDINNKYISLQQNYNELENNYNKLVDIQIKYDSLMKENISLKEFEKKYKDIYYQIKEAEENNIQYKDLKIKYDLIHSENTKLIEIKNKYDKIYPEYIEMKEIRNKYDDILKEQKNLIMIENKYNDLVEEIQELKSIENKYNELMDEKFKEKKEYLNSINKLKGELNETTKNNIILKNQLDLKIKENDELKYFLNEYKNKDDKK